MGGQLYKQSFTYPLLRCLEPDEARTDLAKVHEGVCREQIDNRPQFASGKFRELCASHEIQLRFSSVAYPQTNGLAEVTNRSPIGWTDELPSVLWSLHTTPKTATRESPYSVAFGTEAVLLPEITIPTPRKKNYNERTTNEGIRAGLDMLAERHADAHLKALSYKRAVAKVYN
ncbi:uncharacterized protein LOC135611359 [Musa acuminata AAA Group]|uniref:uncharacterized protein LOC135611359 n=1 Tax=Musa acuminata AAA Group TaxID=214697 RepID=UPI0031DB5DF4